MPDIRHSLAIAARPEAIYQLASTGAGLSKWWAADVTEEGTDGTVVLGFFNRATIYKLKPVLMAAPLEAEWLCESGKEWAGTRIIFKLKPTDNSTLVRFTHAGWQADTDYFVSCNTVWGELMFRLKSAAEGKPAGPLFSATGLAY